MSEPQTESPPTANRWFSYAWRGLILGDVAPSSNETHIIETKTEGETSYWRAVPPDGANIETAADGSLWRHRPQKVEQVFHSQPDPVEEAARLERKQDQQFERHVIEWAKGQYLALFESEPEAPASPAPSEENKFPAPHEKLTDWDVVGDVPAWLVGDQYVREGEDMDERIRRLTDEFRARVNELNNKLLARTIAPDEEAELDDKQVKYHELAELGDRS